MSKLNAQTKEVLINTLRALVADESVQVEFTDEIQNNFFTWDQKLVVNKKRVEVPQIDKYFRASTDLAAAYILFHDSGDVMLSLSKHDYTQEDQRFFDEFEKIRVIAEVKNIYRGAAQNILEKIRHDLSPTASRQDQDQENLSLVLLSEIFSQDFSSNLEKNLDKKIVKEIKNLSKKTSNQYAFSQGVARILEMLKNEKEEQESKTKEQEESQSKSDSPSSNQENIDSKVEEKNFLEEEKEGEGESQKQPENFEMKELEGVGEMVTKSDKSKALEDKIEFRNSYKIYTTKFDEVIFPQKLVAKKELEILRDQLDLKMAKLNTTSRKMALKLKRKLLSKRDFFLEFDSSQGVLDRKKFTRLVTSPLSEGFWINNKNHQYQDTALTILLDNSGSMRGQPIVMSALACETIAEILEKFSVKTEIIGFTTADWKGGKARKLWESSGRSKNPGRLNEVRHIIYKHFNQRFKKAKINLGLMLKEGVLKENIDGEALLFAGSRLMQQSEKRKILLIISDGNPVDDSTSSANDTDILTEHLHHVIKKIERAKKIEIVGIGIGHSTDDFYLNSTSIKSAEDLGDAMIEKVVDLL
ncbi:MAG: hypothetical protein KGP29_03795 [Proteobacteria bacterium]|nr:hypothetical protein [Pseudomonadota bacterium]